jgi:hypothetical protein
VFEHVVLRCGWASWPYVWVGDGLEAGLAFA